MQNSVKTRTIRFHAYGEPADVLRLDETTLPLPNEHRIRVRVHACGLNPADWALCRGLFAAKLPRGIGLEVSGVVDAVGAHVDNVAIGDQVFGAADYAGCELAGASDYAIMKHWAKVPSGLDLTTAAALPMAVETAFRSIENLGVRADQLVMINGAGTMMGFAAVQMALLRGARVIATAGKTYTERLQKLGAKVTVYGDGIVERVRELASGSPDLILDTAPASNSIPDLVEIADGDPRRVLTISDLEGGKKAGTRDCFGEGMRLRYDALDEYAQLAAKGRFTVPIAEEFALQDWRRALDISLSRHAHGKLILLP
ncbi:MAG: NADP-dependent oxidoreductase [Candidatus Obscuribacterales bacterium]|nr:NADP-dependent oxidoreductase [Candidatus Obscuribacterales bacterium]